MRNHFLWKKKVHILGCFFFFLWFFFLKFISPGYVGVVVNMFGEDKGVSQKEMHCGMHWIAPWKTVYEFPIFEQNHTWTGDKYNPYGFTFQTCEGMAVGADIGITYHLVPSEVPVVFQRYRRGMEEITDTFIRNYIRDAINKSASKMRIEDLYGSGKETFFEEVERSVKEDLAPMGIELSRIYLIGRFGFPENVIAALNAKIEAVQRAQQRENELREAEAQAKKEIARAEGAARCALVNAEAQAKANNQVSSSVTMNLIMWEAIQRWDGKMPQVMGQSVQPLLPLGKQ